MMNFLFIVLYPVGGTDYILTAAYTLQLHLIEIGTSLRSHILFMFTKI